MKVGDLVRYRHEDDGRVGLVVEGSMSPTGRFQRTRVYWFAAKQFGSYFSTQLEVINENR